MMIRETFVNETKGHRFGDGEWYEPYTDSLGHLFKEMQREYGRCVSKMYLDGPDDKPIQIGWVFQKRMEYEDARPHWPEERRFYLREVWVEVSATPVKRNMIESGYTSPWSKPA